MPVSVTSYIANRHFGSPVFGSIACTAPWPAASVQLLMGPRRRLGTPGAPGMPRGAAGRNQRQSHGATKHKNQCRNTLNPKGASNLERTPEAYERRIGMSIFSVGTRCYEPYHWRRLSLSQILQQRKREET